MNILRKTFKEIFSIPTTWIFIAAFLFALVVSYKEATGTEEREKWIAACHDLDGETVMDDYSRGVGDSMCLKPNSILTVPIYE